MSLLINNKTCESIHFTGIFGSGMSALAQYLCWQGIKVSGSDRMHTSEDTLVIKNGLLKTGCSLFSQDGSGVQNNTDILCVSTAIEESNPDIIAARARGIPIVHRSDVLAAIIKTKKTIAVAGTSGKSTVTAMIFEFLSSCGKSPSIISGAALKRLEAEGLIGNAYRGNSDLLVIEADESDGTLVKYFPYLSVVLNISKDHKEIPEVLSLFEQLSEHSSYTIVNADDSGLKTIHADKTFGLTANANWKPDRIETRSFDSLLVYGDTTYQLPLPGVHNISNCAAALCICEHLGCSASVLKDAVKSYQGVSRRFSIIKTLRNIQIIDDFAHNPEKIKAAISAARGLSSNLHVIYQPHGFGPTRFLKNEYVSTFRSCLRAGDTLYLLPIYYAGGSTQKDISSKDIIDLIGESEFKKYAVADREEILNNIKNTVSDGESILLMGARDPSLSAFALKIADLFGRLTK
ncbi:MAG: hypothetical protein GX640_18360 [Fibrobacter sp.]|nr:hypothetical protein [Fibrobacter sp.]